MDSKSLEMLEFPRIREILAGYTGSSVSYQLAIGLLPLNDYERISLCLKQTAEARSLLNLDKSFSIGDVLDVREIVKRAALNSVLEPQNLLDIQHTLFSLQQVSKYFDGISNDFPLLWDIVKDIVDLHQIEKDIGKCLDPSGQVVDNASPILADIRHQLREIREQILERLESIVNSPRGRRILHKRWDAGTRLPRTSGRSERQGGRLVLWLGADKRRGISQ